MQNVLKLAHLCSRTAGQEHWFHVLAKYLADFIVERIRWKTGSEITNEHLVVRKKDAQKSGDNSQNSDAKGT